MSPKVLESFEGGAITVTELSGNFYLNFNGSIGGGTFAGILTGSGSVCLGAGTVGLKAAESFLNHLLPTASQQIAQMIENVINAAVATVE